MTEAKGTGFEVLFSRQTLVAWLLAILTTFATQLMTLTMLSSGRFPRFFLPLATFITAALAIVAMLLYAPLLSIFSSRAPRLQGFRAGIGTALLTPVPLLLLWVAYRNRDETLADLLTWIRQSPVETIVATVPLMTGAFVFGVVFTRARSTAAHSVVTGH